MRGGPMCTTTVRCRRARLLVGGPIPACLQGSSGEFLRVCGDSPVVGRGCLWADLTLLSCYKQVTRFCFSTLVSSVLTLYFLEVPSY